MKQDPMEVLMEALVTGDPSAAIEHQEKRGQETLIRKQVLPIKCNGCTRGQIEQLGIVFEQPVDDLFVNVKLPDGWKVRPTSHSMWSDLVDDEGNVRASIYYKAAFYDRDAFISLV